jgi:hypothetical protein
MHAVSDAINYDCSHLLINHFFVEKNPALWGAYLNNDSPTVNGYSIGTDLSNATAWIGRTAYIGYFQPGRVDLPSDKVYFVYGNEEKNVSTGNEYLALPSGCSCRAEPASIASTSVGVVFSTGYGIGVHTWSNGRVSVAKTTASNSEWYPNQAGGVIIGPVGVNNSLVCESIVAGNVKPTIASAGGACGEFETFYVFLAFYLSHFTHRFLEGLLWQ